MSFDLNSLLQQYVQPNEAVANNATDDFEKVTSTVSTDTLAQGVTEALRSDQTPPFAELIGQLFGQGSPEQRAGMLNQLISGLNPSVLSSIAGGVLGSLFHSNDGSATITPELANSVSPDSVQEIAAQAEKTNPGIVDAMGQFYAQHSTLIKTLGGAALAIALNKMAQTRSQ